MPESVNTLVWVLPDVGHYHVPRISAFAELGEADVHVVALSDTGGFKEFKAAEDQEASFTYHVLFHGVYYADLDRQELRAKLFAMLERLRPTTLLIQGWAEPFALLQLEWALRHGVPTVVTSESTADDAPRGWLREKIKSRVVGLFDAGLVGGQAHVSYLHQLGMPRARIFQGYDAVDNDFFADGADAARARSDVRRAEMNLPTRFFLASARFMAKKNLARLVEAYAVYRKRVAAPGTSQPWDLVILGDGPLKEEIHGRIRAAGLQDFVRTPGFQSYQTLPVFYGLASAFVHPSTTEQWGLVVNEAMAAGLPVIVSERCGCAPDLVVDGENGFRFDPEDTRALSNLLQTVAESDAHVLAAMGAASRQRVGDWSPARFADGLRAAVGVARATRRRGKWSATVNTGLTRVLIRLARHHVH